MTALVYLCETDGASRSARDTARQFADKELAPFAAEWDLHGTFPKDTIRRAGELGVNREGNVVGSFLTIPRPGGQLNFVLADAIARSSAHASPIAFSAWTAAGVGGVCHAAPGERWSVQPAPADHAAWRGGARAHRDPL